MQQPHLHIVIDNIRSIFNVGGIFRTADAIGNCKILICGFSPTPEHPKMKKTSLGAELSVPWEKFATTEDAIKNLKAQNIPVYSVEIAEKSENFREITYPNPVALVFGHEVDGVQKQILEQSDRIVHIPMSGIKESLNVAITAGIIMFEAVRD